MKFFYYISANRVTCQQSYSFKDICRMLYNTLFDATLYYLKDIPQTKWMLFMTLINDVLITIILSDLMIRIANGSYTMMPYYLLLQVIGPVISGFIISPINISIVTIIRKRFTTDGYTEYNNLTFNSKVTKNYNGFDQVLGPAENAVRMVVDWGIPNLLGLTSSIIGLIWTFYQKNLLKYLFLFL